MSKKKRITTSGHAGLSSSPFAGLGELRDSLPTHDAPDDEPSGRSSPKPVDPSASRRAIVRYQRKGRGGKAVTRVEGLSLSGESLGEWLRELRKTLACGGFIEADCLVFSGDQRERLPQLLGLRGVSDVVVS